jgi:hypothetical protein
MCLSASKCFRCMVHRESEHIQIYLGVTCCIQLHGAGSGTCSVHTLTRSLTSRSQLYPLFASVSDLCRLHPDQPPFNPKEMSNQKEMSHANCFTDMAACLSSVQSSLSVHQHQTNCAIAWQMCMIPDRVKSSRSFRECRNKYIDIADAVKFMNSKTDTATLVAGAECVDAGIAACRDRFNNAKTVIKAQKHSKDE